MKCINPFSVLMGSRLMIDGEEWELADCHDTRCCMSRSWTGRIPGKDYLQLTPKQLCDRFETGNARWTLLKTHVLVAV